MTRWTIHRSEDRDSVLVMDEELFPDSYRITEEPGNLFWLVRDRWEKCWVGFAAARALRHWSYDPRWRETAFLSRVGVKPSARGQGLQKRLIDRRVAWARDEGFERIVTYVGWGNTASIRSLVQRRFLPYIPSYHWAGDVIYLEREIC